MVNKEKLSEWCWLSDKNIYYAFTRMLFKANYESKQWRDIVVGRGQLVCGVESYAAELGFSTQSFRTILKNLKKTGDIELKSTNKYTVVTICDYDSWVCFNSSNNTETNKQTNNQLTNNQQTTNNNIINKEINNKKNKDATASLQLEFEEPEIKSKVSDFDFDAFLDYFNKTLKANNSIIPSLRKIDERRKNVIHARIKDYGTDAIYEVVQKASVSSFMNGGGSKGWKANFDWMFGPDNFRKVLEGNYDDMDTKKPNAIGNYGFSGLQFPKDPRHGDIFNNHYYDANEDRWIADGEKDRLGRVFSIQMKKWLI